MTNSLVNILNSIYWVVSIFGLLVLIFFIFNICWRYQRYSIKGVIRTDDIDILALSKRNPSKLFSIAKRIFDLTFSLCGFILLLPVIFGVSFLIKIIYQKQSILVKRSAIGVNGKTFNALFFRTIDEYSGQRGKFGHFLKNTNIDNLPLQLNVIKGELSMVGRSRAIEILLKQNKKLEEPYDRLLSIRPGITSLAAVLIYRTKRPTDTHLDELKYDLLYYANMSLILDMVLMLRTILLALGSSSGKYLTKE